MGCAVDRHGLARDVAGFVGHQVSSQIGQFSGLADAAQRHLGARRDRAGALRRHQLLARTRSLAQRLRPVPLSPLQVQRLGPYVVLVTPDHHTAASDLASACVIELDDLRQPLTPDELARRQPATLGARELELLHRYGYPHVLERFRFHLTLTDPVNEAQAAQVTEAVSNQVDRLNAQTPLTLDRLCIFEEPAPGQAFRRVHDLVLGA